MLRPLVCWLAAHNYTSNQITLSAFALLLFAGITLSILGQHQQVFWLVPIVLFVRMALHACHSSKLVIEIEKTLEQIKIVWVFLTTRQPE